MSSQALEVTVALPVRDAAPWLAEALDSVLAQQGVGFEVLAVDDDSRDGSGHLLAGYARRDPRVRLLATSEGGRGIAAALNLALAEARAPLLARMDADDRMLPGRLSEQVAALRQDPSLFAVSCRARAFPEAAVGDGMRAYLAWQNSLETPEEIARDRFIESPVLHPSVMMRTPEVRERLGGWREQGWPEDWDFFSRALGAGLRIGRVPRVLLEWRLHESQSTRTRPEYSEDALRRARAHFLARHLRAAGRAARPLWILGAGPVGKALAKALAVEGVVASGLVDVDPRKIGGMVRGAGCCWPVVAGEDVREVLPRPFAVSAVAGAQARARVRAELDRWGWREGDDFAMAA